MSKGTRSVLPGKYLPALVLVIVLSGLLLTVSACENLNSETSASVSMDTIAQAVQSAETATTAAVTTIPAGSTGTSVAEKDAPDHPEDLPVGVPESFLEMAPVATMVPMGYPWTRFEENDPRLVWGSNWEKVHSSLASAGAYRIQTGNSGMYVAFEGTRIRLIALTDSMYGRARLQLDGELWLVDLYSASPASGTVWTSPVLAPGTHHLEIDARQAGPNPASTGEDITFDAVDVIGTLVED